MFASRKAGFLVILASLYFPPQSLAASTFDIDVNELDRKDSAAKPKTARPKKPKPPKPKKAPKPIIYEDGYAKYTVQESDFRTRLLAKHLHLPEEELLRLLPEILRLNGISNLSELEIGQTLIVPLPAPAAPPAESGAPPAPGSPVPPHSPSPAAPSENIGPEGGSGRR
ncbi:hypothetical protein LPW11_06760 [Geomonas sp. RF6]|uniref:LysM peptidoglycan-binding domain-containing protein n=1 Tax=Geomonas sp. RF6 TaxID=2897342 RepID=UPI001E34CEB9|nr:LysM peptidoglycan-binding domain-containing protein [Geomonas sp. RF6]UFS71889.1 hypothetical protein LPW11_06760 [Geomonas sp. RF6]